MAKLTCTTPHGVFTRETARPYKWVALHRRKDGTLCRAVGNNHKPLPFRAFWSSTREGALKLAANYPYEEADDIVVLGVWPVD